MKPEDILPGLQEGECIEVYTTNSLHTGFYVECKTASHIPRIYLAMSRKFIHQPQEKQCFDHIMSIDLDKITDIWVRSVWAHK